MATTETSQIQTARPEPLTAVIRRGGLCDLEALAPLSAALHQECQRDQPAPSQQLGWLRREALAWGGRLLVAQAGEKIVGYCAYNMRQARLHEIFVLPEYRGQAIGRDLLAFAERDLEHANVLALRVAVDNTGERARAFFARQGFCAGATEDLRLGWQKAL